MTLKATREELKELEAHAAPDVQKLLSNLRARGLKPYEIMQDQGQLEIIESDIINARTAYKF